MKKLSFGLLKTAIILVFTLFLIQCGKTEGTATGNSPAYEQMVYGNDKSAKIENETDGVIECIYTCVNGMPFEELSETEISTLNFVREEELLARDIYISMYQKYSIPVFNNISNSEEIHTTAVKALLEKYNLPDPAADHVLGVFANPEIQELYNTLLAQGSQSLHDAIIVGETIEDYDIADLVYHVNTDVDNIDITYVINQLHRGSRNHMRAFYAHLGFHGLTYTPQYITQEMYDAIVNSPWEIGNGFCMCQYNMKEDPSNRKTE